MQTATLITYSLVAAASVISPGPATMLAIRNGAAGGVRAVVPSTLGNVTGLFLLSAAAMLGLTIETARNYSKKIYAKTGARGQPELVRIILTSVLAIS